MDKKSGLQMTSMVHMNSFNNFQKSKIIFVVL